MEGCGADTALYFPAEIVTDVLHELPDPEVVVIVLLAESVVAVEALMI